MIVSSEDVNKLRTLLGALPHDASGDAASELGARVDGASVVDPGSLPRDLITLGSAVMLRDLESGAHHYLLLVLPEEKRAGADVSVLEPLGLALLGRRIGEIIEWLRPSGRRRLRIESVQQPRYARVAGLAT